jgi:hypothetical protein
MSSYHLSNSFELQNYTKSTTCWGKGFAFFAHFRAIVFHLKKGPMFRENSAKRLREEAAAHVSALNQKDFESWYLQYPSISFNQGNLLRLKVPGVKVSRQSKSMLKDP